MARNIDLQKHTLNLFAGDFEAIATYFPDVDTSVIIRRVIRKFVEQIEQTGPSINAKVEIEI